MKVGLVGSNGGHLLQLWLLQDWWRQHERFWVTFRKLDAESMLDGERVHWGHHPTNRNFQNFFRNLFLARQVLREERPDIIISTGAGIAVPFFLMARIMAIKTVFIEEYNRIDTPTLTGRMVYRVADLFIIQWPELKRFYPRAHHFGGIL